jgi:hypothetical protein
METNRRADVDSLDFALAYVLVYQVGDESPAQTRARVRAPC